QDVRVVTVRDGCERTGPLDPRLDQHVTVESDSNDGLTGKTLTKPTEGLRLAVDHGDRVTSLGQLAPKSGTNSSTPDYDNVHRVLPH
ncbi:MAG: hypothetical protein RL080_325, partial [Actinomycetota bacterium]